MKRILCLVLSLVLLLSCSALAEGTEEKKEITFQGVPWGSSFEETCRILLDNGIINKENESYFENVQENIRTYLFSLQNYSRSCFSQEGIEVKLTDDFKAIKGGFSFGGIGVRNAGYEVAQFDMTYAYDEYTNETALLFAMVTLIVNDVEEAYIDLTEKLTTVYGECERTGWSGSDNIWKGPNNTAVALAQVGIPVVMPLDANRVSLLYGTLDAQEILDEYLARNPITTPEPVDSTDVSGL